MHKQSRRCPEEKNKAYSPLAKLHQAISASYALSEDELNGMKQLKRTLYNLDNIPEPVTQRMAGFLKSFDETLCFSEALN